MHYWLADRYLFHNDYEKAAEHYQKAIFFNPLGNYHLYERLDKIYEVLNKQEEREVIYQFLFQELERTEIYSKKNQTLAKTLYSIGEEYLSQGKKEEAVKWWQMATNAAPEWSYFYLETASLYLELEEPTKAELILEKCLGFYYPKEHCQEYLNKLSEGVNFELPGYWHSRILAIPDD